jgi:hypothetical protein
MKSYLSLFIQICQDQSTAGIPIPTGGTVKQFIDNYEQPSPNLLRIIHMESYAGMEPSLFSSDHIAWRDTRRYAYCHREPTNQSSLRWSDISMTNTIQFWKLIPAGFGAFFDIRSGQQWVIIATPCPPDNDRTIPDDSTKSDSFTQWDHYLYDFNPMDPQTLPDCNLEAIRLEPGTRL